MEGTPCGKSLTRLFARVGEALLASLHDELNASGLSVGDWRLLKSLRGNETDTERRAPPSGPANTRAIRRMAQTGFVRRCAANADRLGHVRLTSRGQAVVRRLAVLEVQLERMTNEALGRRASRELKAKLARFIRSVETREKALSRR